MREIDPYNIGITNEELQAALSTLRGEFDNHNHDGTSSRSFQTLMALTLVAQNIYIYSGTMKSPNIIGGIITGGTIRTAASGQRIVLSNNKFIAYDSSGNPLVTILDGTSEMIKTYAAGSIGAITLIDSNYGGSASTADVLSITVNQGSSKALNIYNSGSSTSLITTQIVNAAGYAMKIQQQSAAAQVGLWFQQLDLDKTGIFIVDNTSNNPSHEALVEILNGSTSSGLVAILTLQGNATTKPAAIRMVSIGGDPASPGSGDIWFDGSELHIRIGATTYHLNKTAA